MLHFNQSIDQMGLFVLESALFVKPDITIYIRSELGFIFYVKRIQEQLITESEMRIQNR